MGPKETSATGTYKETILCLQQSVLVRLNSDNYCYNIIFQVDINDPDLLKDPEALLQATKKGKTIMVFVKVRKFLSISLTSIKNVFKMQNTFGNLVNQFSG